jgi:hypothetical protein
MEEVELYWKSEWEERVQNNEKAEWRRWEVKEKMYEFDACINYKTTSVLSKLMTGSLVEAIKYQTID